MKTTNHQKFETKNPVAKGLIGRFHKTVTATIADLQPGNLLELGCGEGFFLDALKKRLPDLPVLGLDYSDEALANGKKVFPNLPLEKGDIYKIEQPDASWDVVVASEVLEHLEHPDEALRELRRVTKRYVVLTVPWEPWFQLGSLARGKHLNRLGNHPEHINHWSPKSFRGFVGEFLTVEKMVTIGAFPWMIVVAHR
jgi:SAM-dependent methyltransferase